MGQLTFEDVFSEMLKTNEKKPPKIWQSLTSCTIDCPECGRSLDWNRDCKCGQAIDWSEAAVENGTRKSPDLKAVEWYKKMHGIAPGGCSEELIKQAREEYRRKKNND